MITITATPEQIRDAAHDLLSILIETQQRWSPETPDEEELYGRMIGALNPLVELDPLNEGGSPMSLLEGGK